MSAHASDGEMTASAFDALEIGKLTWIGLILAGIGWVMMIGETAVADIIVSTTPRTVSATFHADLVDIAKCIIASGFAIAVIGALQSGFGTLNRFFTAVLVRSSQRGHAAPSPGPVAPAASTRGGRPYRLLPDGSVEVETILGTRRFATMHEARDFI